MVSYCDGLGFRVYRISVTNVYHIHRMVTANLFWHWPCYRPKAEPTTSITRLGLFDCSEFCLPHTNTHTCARANIERQLLLGNHIFALLNSTRPYHLFLPLWVDAEAAKIGAGGIHIWPGLEQLGSPWHTRAREGNSWCSTWCCDSCCKPSLYFFPKLSWRKLNPLNAPISCCWKNPGRRILCDAALHVPCISAVFLRCQAVPRKMFQGLGTLGKSAYKKQWLRCSGICWQMVASEIFWLIMMGRCGWHWNWSAIFKLKNGDGLFRCSHSKVFLLSKLN